MSKRKRRTPTMESAIKRDLRSPLYKMRVVESKVGFKRERKHKNIDYQFISILKVVINWWSRK